MFPIRDQRGRVIAFGGRALSADVPAKYLNSPETPIFHKGEVLYNFDKARAARTSRTTPSSRSKGMSMSSPCIAPGSPRPSRRSARR